MSLENQLEDILDSSKYLLSDIKPSLWAEQNRVMTPDVTPWPGPFSFRLTPYMREPLDCISQSHPARIVAFMSGAQIGKSTNLIENAIGYIISQSPGNILFMSGHELLAEEAMNKKIDQMIDSCGLRPLIRPSILRKKNQRTGDTSKAKEFPGGSLTAGSASNHLLLRQRSIQYGFIDDFDSVEKQSKKSGNTRSMIQGRFAAYYDKMKLFYISTPELKASSNIEPVFLLGDQRRYHVPCPSCGELIPLYWEVDIEGTEGREKGGMTWKTDESGRLIDGTVGYVCQKCSNFFDDSLKYEMNLAGEWRASAEPSQIGYYSYHISSLYAPPGTYDWEYYVREWLEACPPNAKKSEQKYQAFINLNLGLTYEPSREAPEASVLQKNIRGYEVGTLPESLSISDGNGKIVLLTCACDLNGTEQDARLDYEIKAWAESGVSYSVKHGSIGTFVPRENTVKHKQDRERWTYFHYKERSVWPELRKIINDVYKTDTHFPLQDDIRNVGRPMRIALTGVDTGHYTQFAYEFIDNNPKRVIGIKGDKESRYRKFDLDSPSFKPSKERGDLYLLDVNFIKDQLAERMKLVWDRNERQPFGFMNFPTPSGGLYLYQNYFEHYQSEHKVSETKDGEVTGFRWVKQTSNSQNHFWDCFDKETEVLTNEGWKYFIQVTNEKLATVNLETDTIEFQEPLALIKKDYEGELILIQGKRVNACITPTHRMVVHRKKWNKKTNSGRMQNIPQIVIAKDLRVTDCIKLSSNWREPGDDFIILPELRDNQGRIIAFQKKIPSKVWAAFIGIYVAEGYKITAWNNKRGSYAHVVFISQNEGKKLDEIINLMDKMPFKYHVRTNHGKNKVVVITQKQLYLALENLGQDCYSKRSGEWIKHQSHSTIKEFLKFAILGDGYENKKHGHRKYYTTSKLLADDIQELFIKTGNQGNISLVYPQKCKLSGTADAAVQYHISENKSASASLRLYDNTPVFKRIFYSGMVYCATVPNGTLICRREGKSFVAGNCAVYNQALCDIIVDQTLREFGIKKGTWQDFVKKIIPR